MKYHMGPWQISIENDVRIFLWGVFVKRIFPQQQHSPYKENFGRDWSPVECDIKEVWAPLDELKSQFGDFFTN